MFWLLLETAGSLLATAFLLRAAAWRVQLSARNPLVQFVIALTDWLVKPVRRMLPATRTTDWASLAGALLIALVLAIVRSLLAGGTMRAPALGAVLLLAVFWLLKWSLYLASTLVIVRAVLSWVNPHAPLAPAVERLTEPLLAPVRRVIPTVGGVDLSPLVVIVVAQFALMTIESLLIYFIAPRF